jgi:hypothetical protein
MNRQVNRIALLFCSAALLAAPLAAQSVKTAGVKGQASAKDSNIVSNKMTNSVNQKVTAPEKKGGPKSRGAYGTCDIHVDNRTPYYLTFYFNGNVAGSIGPWGDLYPNMTQGFGTFYGRAVFDDGSVLTFGPRDYQCNGTDFTWTLTP